MKIIRILAQIKEPMRESFIDVCHFFHCIAMDSVNLGADVMHVDTLGEQP